MEIDQIMYDLNVVIKSIQEQQKMLEDLAFLQNERNLFIPYGDEEIRRKRLEQIYKGQDLMPHFEMHLEKLGAIAQFLLKHISETGKWELEVASMEFDRDEDGNIIAIPTAQ